MRQNELVQGERSTSPFTFSKTWNKLKYFFSNPLYFISMLSLIFLTVTIVIPLWEIISTSFQWQQQDTRVIREAVPGEATVYHWGRVLYSPISESLLYKPLLNSLSIGIGVTILAGLLGGALAWLVIRTDISFKGTITFLALVPYMLPSWLYAFAWLAIFKNERLGGSSGFIKAVFNVNTPDFLAYGYFPIVITLTLNYFPFFFIMIAAALSSMNNSLEESAQIMGARFSYTVRKITLPLIIPAVLSGVILTFSKAIGTFGVPAFLGLPIRYYTLSTMLFGSFRSRLISEASILAIILLSVSMVLILLNQKIIGTRKNYTTIGGKDTRKKLNPLGKWLMPSTILVTSFLCVIVFVPIAILLLQSFMLQSNSFSLDNFTLHFWIGQANEAIGGGEVGVLNNSNMGSALRNSVLIAVVASVSATLMGLLFGYVIAKGRNMLATKIIDQLSFVPYLIPGIAFSAIYITMFAKPFLFIPALYGTMALLMLITTVGKLPIATRSGTASMFQIGNELEEAALIQGASWFRRLRKILIPLSKKGLFGAFLLLFVSAIKELDLIILLVTPSTRTLTTLVYGYAEQGFQQYANVIMLILVFIIFVTYYIAKRFGNADLTKGIGG